MRPPPLKLLMTADAVGGVFPYALDLAGALTPHGIETTIAVLGPPMSGQQAEAAGAVAGLTVRSIDLPLDWLAESPRHVEDTADVLARLAGEMSADVVQLHAPALAVASYPAPVLAVLHSCLATWWAAVKTGPLPPDFVWRTHCTADGLAQADMIVCPSGALADAAARIYGLRPVVVHNGRTRSASRVPHGDAPTFAFTAGRLWDEGKNVRTLDEAAGRMRLPLHAAGPLEGPHGGRVHLRKAIGLGPLDEAAVRLQFSHGPIFLSSALYEPFGLAVLEAAQAGCPLVLADIPTFRELWDGAALFVPAQDAAGFAEAANAIAASPPLYRQLGAAARTRSRLYDLARTASAMATLLHNLAARSGAPSPSLALAGGVA